MTIPPYKLKIAFHRAHLIPAFYSAFGIAFEDDKQSQSQREKLGGVLRKHLISALATSGLKSSVFPALNLDGVVTYIRYSKKFRADEIEFDIHDTVEPVDQVVARKLYDVYNDHIDFRLEFSAQFGCKPEKKGLGQMASSIATIFEIAQESARAPRLLKKYLRFAERKLVTA